MTGRQEETPMILTAPAVIEDSRTNNKSKKSNEGWETELGKEVHFKEGGRRAEEERFPEVQTRGADIDPWQN